MERSDLEHIIRAAADILSVDELVIVGSQSILGRYPNAPSPLKMSMEADVYPLSDPDPNQTEIKLAGLMGEMSYFFKTFGIWVDPVTERTSTLPDGWKDRLVEICNANTNGAVGWCLDPTDLAIAKHVAGREKDIAFTRTMVRHGLVDEEAFLERLETVDVTQEHREIIRQRFKGQVEDKPSL